MIILLHQRNVLFYPRWIRHLTITTSCLSLSQCHSRQYACTQTINIPSKPSSFGLKQLHDEAYKSRSFAQDVSSKQKKSYGSNVDRWELTVGIEIHAQLNTERKLFSGMDADP